MENAGCSSSRCPLITLRRVEQLRGRRAEDGSEIAWKGARRSLVFITCIGTGAGHVRGFFRENAARRREAVASVWVSRGKS